MSEWRHYVRQRSSILRRLAGRKRNPLPEGLQDTVGRQTSREQNEAQSPFKGRTVADAVAPILVETAKRNKHRWSVGRYLLDLVGEVELVALDAGHISRVQNAWGDNAQSTRRHYSIHLRWYCRAFHLQGAPELEGCVQVGCREKGRIVRPTATELDRLFACPNLTLRFFIVAAAEAGLRFSTIASLCPKHIAEGRIEVTTKFGSAIVVPVSDRLAAILANLPQAAPVDTTIGSLLEGRPLRAFNTTIHDRFNAWKKVQNVRPEIRFHDLRRGLAHRLYKATGDLRSVQALLGHDQLSSTLHYLNAGQASVDRLALNTAIADRSNP